MQILFDARTLDARYPGIGRYVFNLLRELPSAAGEGQVKALVPLRASERFPHPPLAQAGVELIPCRPGPRGLRPPRALRRLAREAQIAHSPYYYSVRPLPCPQVVTIYDLIGLRFPADLPSPLHRLAYRRAMRRAVRSASRILTLSEFARRELQGAYGLAEEQVVVTPAAAAPEMVPATSETIGELRRRLALPERFALYLGTRKRHKNLPRLLHAWGELEAAGAAPPPLVIGGPGDRRQQEAEAAAKRLAPGRVFFLGPVLESDLAALYSAAELFVFPSLHEGFGLPVLEAMACGTPVACAHATSLPEVAGDAAAAFDPEDTHSLAETLARLLQDPGERRERAERGRRQAARFTWRRTAELTIEAYRQALAGSAP